MNIMQAEDSSHGQKRQDYFEIPAGVAIIESQIHEHFVSDITVTFMQLEETDSGARAFVLSLPPEAMENLFFKVWEHCRKQKEEKERRQKKHQPAPAPTPPSTSNDDDIPF